MVLSKNLFATILTHEAPSSNFEGQLEANRSVLQKISRNGKKYLVISSEAIRNALRESLAASGLPCNRKRLYNENQPTVEFASLPNPEIYADDFIFGYLVLDSKTIPNMKAPRKRDSLLRNNLAVALEPYLNEVTFHQAPAFRGSSPFKNQENSALYDREISFTSFQYPLAVSISEASRHPQGLPWLEAILKSVGELTNVGSAQSRRLFDLSPRSLILRVTPQLVAGFSTYAFGPDGTWPELTRLKSEDLPASEFWIAGEMVRKLTPGEAADLTGRGCRLFENPQVCIQAFCRQHLEKTDDA